MKLKTTASLLVLAGLTGCSTLGSDTREQPVVRFGPTPVLTPQVSVSESMYAMARLAHDQGQLATAAQRYRRTLEMKPDHVGALNGLGVILAQDGRTGEALQLLARARDLAPGAGHIHNNLGYTLLREQRLDEAQVSLRMARELQPGSQQTLRNLALLERARTDQAKQQTAAARPQPAPSANAATPAGPVQIVSVAPQVFELRLSGTLAGLQPASLAAVAAVASAEPGLAAPETVSQSPMGIPDPLRHSGPVVVAPTARIVPGPEPSVMVLQLADSLVLPQPAAPVAATAQPEPVQEMACKKSSRRLRRKSGLAFTRSRPLWSCWTVVPPCRSSPDTAKRPPTGWTTSSCVNSNTGWATCASWKTAVALC
jgi:hypothetical protein